MAYQHAIRIGVFWSLRVEEEPETDPCPRRISSGSAPNEEFFDLASDTGVFTQPRPVAAWRYVSGVSIGPHRCAVFDWKLFHTLSTKLKRDPPALRVRRASVYRFEY